MRYTPMEINVDYNPHPKQRQLHASAANEILWGGAAGGGKSRAVRAEAYRWATVIPGLQVYLFRRTFSELEDNHVIPSLSEVPASLGTYSEQKHRWNWFNASKIHLCHCQHEKDVFKRQGAEIHLLLIDELTTFTEFIYDYLRARLRCTLDVPAKYKHKIPGIICGSNPGNIGHEFVKRRWVDSAEPLEIKKAPDKEGGMYRQYIPSRLEDNPTLTTLDPDYIHRLDALPEPYRTAYKEGDWDIFIGQMFQFNRRDHVVKPLPVPEDTPLMMTFDWGFGAPYSLGWWWVDPDGRLYRFTELYGCMQGQINVGVRQTDDEIAEQIIKHEAEQGISGRQILRLCDPTSFNRKPDYRGGGQGPSTAEVFARQGLTLQPGDPSRILKIRQFHARLRVKERNPDGTPTEMPMLVVYDTCEAFIRTIAVLQADPLNPEDIDHTQESHVYDDSCHAVMARPLGTPGAKAEANVDNWTIKRG